ncbi:MAG TPA: hypothetical protein VMV72_00730 [Verrucomicrobiae bacterium]|nr:hypothetical protein [Verrucomicrobiae bacterium]
MTNVRTPMMNRYCSSFRRVGAIALAAIGLMATRTSQADTNLVNRKSWVVDGTDDPATNASLITVTVNGHPMGAFGELAFSYNIEGTNVLPVGVVKGSGEIKLALPNGPFGGSFFLTGYWDCDAGYLPTMTISDLDIRVKGGKKAVVEMKGKISNGVTMAAKDFELIMMMPEPQLVQAEVSYRLMATADVCVDDVIHTNQDNFQIARMASNYLSAEENENNVARFSKVTSHTCVLEYCNTTTKTFCYGLANQDSLVLTNKPPSLGAPAIWLVNNATANTNAPTLGVKFLVPSKGTIKPQGLEQATADPTAENVSFWGNWRKAKASYRAGKKVTQVRYMLVVKTPGRLSCDYNN